MAELAAFNAAGAEEARRMIAGCCASRRWLEGMIVARPFASLDALKAHADALCRTLGRDDVLEAMSHHPRIGEAPKDSAREQREQAGAVSAAEAVKAAIMDGNRAYEARFGHIYLVCATGKSGEELLAILTARLQNEPDAEMAVARDEQAKIAGLRLDKLFAPTERS